jgi:hypothetical protein
VAKERPKWTRLEMRDTPPALLALADCVPIDGFRHRSGRLVSISGLRGGALRLCISGPGADRWSVQQRAVWELIGEDVWGVQVYPPRAELVDTSPKWFVWIHPLGERPSLGWAPGDETSPGSPLSGPARKWLEDAP